MPPELLDDEEENFEEYVGQEGDLAGLTADDIKSERREEPQKPDESNSGEVTAEKEVSVPATEAAEKPVQAEPPKSTTEKPKVDEAPKRNSYQERIYQLTQARYQAERRAEEAEAKLAGKASHAPAAEKTAPDLKEPNSDDFDTWDQYYVALADYRAEKKIREWQEAEKKSKQVAFISQRQADFNEKLISATEKYPDFDDVVRNPVVPINKLIYDIVVEMDDPAPVLYYLGKNIADARRISIMTPVQAARAIGKIEVEIAADAKLNPPIPQTETDSKTKKISNAPPPINPLSGASSTATKDPEKMSHEEYRKWRAAGGK